MSYDDQERRHRHRDSRRSRPKYEEEEIVETRSGPQSSRTTDLVRRRDDSIEDIDRDFPPGDPYIQRRSTRRARSDGRGRYDDDDYYEDTRRRNRRYDDRRSKRRDYSESSSESRSPPRRRKSLGEQALAALGIGSVAAAANRRSRSRDRSRDGRHRRRSYSSSSSRSRDEDQGKKFQQAVKAALTAGAAEAFRSRKEPGGWTGAKGKRVLTSMVGAGGISELVNKDPDKKGTRHTIEAVIGGLAGNRLLNGERDRSRSRKRSKSHGRDGGGGGLGGLALGGLAAAAGKALLDHRNRSKSRGRRSYSSDSDSQSPPRNKKRSKSVSEYVSRGMAAVGLGDSGRDRRRDDDRYSRSSRRDRDYYEDYGQQGRLRGGGGEGGDGISSGCSSDTEISSSEEDRTQAKMHRKEFLTAGLASVATIHAAHSVYKSFDNRKKRKKLVAKGEMSEEQSEKLKNKAHLQDAAAVGIAALGIKGAVSEWKEMKEQREEYHKFEKERAERHEKRLKHLEHHLARVNSQQFRRSEPNLIPATHPDAPNYYTPGPNYYDDNPYHSGASLPPPPMGPPQARY